MTNVVPIQNDEPEVELTLDQEFDLFYAAYPRRKSKGAARLAYKRARKLATFEEIMQGVKDFTAYCTSEATEMKYIKHPSTWLNQECWDDDLTPSTDTLGGGSGGGWGDLL